MMEKTAYSDPAANVNVVGQSRCRNSVNGDGQSQNMNNFVQKKKNKKTKKNNINMLVTEGVFEVKGACWSCY